MSTTRIGKRKARRRLRVLAIGHSYVIASNRAVMRELAADPRFEITVATPKVLDGDLRRVACEPEPATSRLAVIGLDATFTRQLNLLEYDAAQLARLMARQPFDIVYAWIEPWTLAARQIVATLGPRTPRFCFSTFQNIAEKYPPPFAEIEKRVAARADRWLAGTEEIRQIQIARGYPAGRARVLPLAVDTTCFRPNTQRETQDILCALKLRPPVVGFAGRLVEEKGLDVVMAALERLDPAVPWSLLLMGSGPYEEIVRAWARRRRCTRRVKVRLLKHDEVPRYLAAVDVLLVPSQTRPHWREQFGRVVMEGFAAGVPVIVSDSGALPSSAGDAARVVGERDIEEWRRAIAALLGDAEARNDLSRRGRARAELFATTTVARALVRILRSMGT